MTRSAIVVVNYRSHELLDEHLPELCGGSFDPLVVVVDNFSDRSERDAVQALASSHGWELLLAANDGFGAGMNLGVRWALQRGCDAVVLMNPDIVVDRTTMSALVDRVRGRPDALLTPALDRPDGSVWFAGGQLDRRRGMTSTRPDRDAPLDERWLTAACLVVHRELWERLGGFDDGYFMYWEDVDLSQRCLAIGGELVIADDLHVVHQVGATQGVDGKSPLYSYYMCRNRLLFAARQLTRREQVRWCLGAPRYAVRVVLRSSKWHLLRHPAVVARAVTGTLAGWALVARSARRAH